MCDWSPQSLTWSPECHQLLKINPPPAQVTTEELITKSDSFPMKFAIDNIKTKNLQAVPKEILTRNINSAYPLVHENVLNLYAKYILYKRQFGNKIEKELYKNMDVIQFVDRLLTKRAVCFYGKRDRYLLMNGVKGLFKWETIGTLQEKPPLILKDCLSYEEIKLSAFLSASTYSYFNNIGDRKNKGNLPNSRQMIEDEGVIVGIIGPRLVLDNFMDYQELVISNVQNCKENGYGNVESPTIHQLFAELFEEPHSRLYEEVEANLNSEPGKYTKLKRTQKAEEIFDNFLYHKRLVFSLDSFFLEANQRAKERNRFAYAYVVGIGLGVWRKDPCQVKMFMDTCAQRIKALGESLYNVSDICFGWIKHHSCGQYKNGDTIPIEGHPKGGIKIYISNREPHEKLTGPDEGKLLVASFAWDGNALPGNEFWMNLTGSSGDSAAASSTQIAELLNPFINPKMCGANLKVVTREGLKTVEDYLKYVQVRGIKRKEN